jgi:DNA polymerase-3 subunit delta'
MAEESQNALLKTLEEPAPFAHLILITAEPEALLETVRSRCQPVTFVALSAEALSERLGDRVPEVDDRARLAVARLAGGDMKRALFLLSPEGVELRAAALAAVRAARSGELGDTPQAGLLAAAEETGKRAGDEARARGEELAAEWGDRGPAARRRAREVEEGARRSGRRARTDALDLGLALVAGWTRDLAAVAEGAPELAFNADRLDELAADAEGLDPRRARRAAEVVMETRRRLTVNVSEQLALDALLYRLESVLAIA